MVPINVVPGEPTSAACYVLCRAVNNLDDDSAKEVSHRHGAPEEAGGDGLEAFGGLSEKEL